jgi:hypothetical protein
MMSVLTESTVTITSSASLQIVQLCLNIVRFEVLIVVLMKILTGVLRGTTLFQNIGNCVSFNTV